MMRKLAHLVAAGVISVAVMAATSATALAGPAATISIGGSGYLQPDGSVIVTINYSCVPGFGTGSTGVISGDVEQTQGFGTGSATAICDDTSHSVRIDVGPGPFVLADAAASFTITTGLNETATSQAEINIQKS